MNPLIRKMAGKILALIVMLLFFGLAGYTTAILTVVEIFLMSIELLLDIFLPA